MSEFLIDELLSKVILKYKVILKLRTTSRVAFKLISREIFLHKLSVNFSIRKLVSLIFHINLLF